MNNIKLVSPSEMSASARAGEITAILAAAIIRTFVGNEPKQRIVSLDFLPDQRVHTTPY
jgi:multisubunit Na+/H+ antiporter MnhF subunit